MSRALKAQRLADGGKVNQLDGFRFIVTGDTDTYRVALFDNGWLCSCEWGRRNATEPCSHVLAAALVRMRQQEAVA